MTDLVERLRDAVTPCRILDIADLAEAADEITRLRAENEKLKCALGPIRTLLLFSEAQLHGDADLVFHFRDQIRLTFEFLDDKDRGVDDVLP
jgi:hypothetical protein